MFKNSDLYEELINEREEGKNAELKTVGNFYVQYGSFLNSGVLFKTNSSNNQIN